MRFKTHIALALLFTWGLACPANRPALAAQEDHPATRFSLRALPFTGITVPHQQLAGFKPSLPLGVGLEVLYTEQIAMVLDLTSSWHRGGRGGDGNVQISSLQLLGRWRFLGKPWIPFAQAGVGGYQAELDDAGSDDQYGGLGVSLGGGVEVPLSNHWWLQVEGRSNWATGEESTHGREIWLGHSQLMTWCAYRFE